MTTDELDSELSERSPNPLTVADVLNICDRILGEPARRRHLFAWLRAPGAASDEWLPVDGYYPANKLVVVWHATPGATDNLYSELVPAHGFRLLELTPDAVGADRQQAEARLRARIEALGAAPRREREPQPRPAREPQPRRAGEPRREREPQAREVRDSPPRNAAVARTFASAAPAAAVEASPLGAAFGAVLGAVLSAVVVAELYLGVAVVGFGHGQPVLAFAFALDACARTLGTAGAGHVGLREWAWLCALGGSPLVAAFASSQRQGQVATEPTPLAGVLSLLALALAAIGALIALAG